MVLLGRCPPSRFRPGREKHLPVRFCPYSCFLSSFSNQSQWDSLMVSHPNQAYCGERPCRNATVAVRRSTRKRRDAPNAGRKLKQEAENRRKPEFPGGDGKDPERPPHPASFTLPVLFLPGIPEMSATSSRPRRPAARAAPRRLRRRNSSPGHGPAAHPRHYPGAP